MERGRFYRFVDLYDLVYGKAFYLDLQRSDDDETPWLLVMKVLD